MVHQSLAEVCPGPQRDVSERSYIVHPHQSPFVLSGLRFRKSSWHGPGGKLVFAQLMQHLPLTTFRRCVTRYRGAFKVKSFSCLDQFLCMAFAQLTFRESLRA